MTDRVARALEQARASEAGDDALTGCRRAALSRGTYGALRDKAVAEPQAELDEARFGWKPPKAQAAEVEGFNLHASVVVGAKDLAGRERLLRYVARPAVVLDRVSELEDGRVAWRLKQPGRKGETHRIMEPMEFLARLAALVPPPRHPLVRYHGVFAPNSPWRAAIVPGRHARSRGCESGWQTATTRSETERTKGPGEGPSGNDVFTLGEVARPAGLLPSRIDWATLLHRVWGWDVLKCPKCDGRMKFLATITDRAVIVRILTHLGLSATEVVPAPARRWDDTS